MGESSEELGMTIRRAVVADAVEIADIYRYYVENTTVSFETEAPDAAEMSRRLQNFIDAGFPYIVAEIGGKVVGYAYAHPWKERAAYRQTWETTVYLANGQEAHGIGTKLMQTLMARSKESGCHVLIACITAENMQSRRFHEHLGFQLVSEFHQVGFKQNRYLDVVDYEFLGE